MANIEEDIKKKVKELVDLVIERNIQIILFIMMNCSTLLIEN